MRAQWTRGQQLTALALAFCAASLAPTVAFAMCDRDSDCEQDQRCEDGTCRRPPPRAQPASETAPSPNANAERRWHVSIAASGVAGYREGGTGAGSVTGVGGWASWELGGLMLAAEFVSGPSATQNLSGLLAGFGWVIPVGDDSGVSFMLFGGAGLRETTKWSDASSIGQTRYRQHDYFVLFPHIRFGSALFAQLGPQVGLGPQEVTQYAGSVEKSSYSNTAVSLQGALQVGYRF